MLSLRSTCFKIWVPKRMPKHLDAFLSVFEMAPGKMDVPYVNGAHGVVVSHPLSMREALGSIPSVSMLRVTPDICPNRAKPNTRCTFCTILIIPAIAQLVEHLTVECCSNQMVPGSIPGGRTSRFSALRGASGQPCPRVYMCARVVCTRMQNGHAGI